MRFIQLQMQTFFYKSIEKKIFSSIQIHIVWLIPIYRKNRIDSFI